MPRHPKWTLLHPAATMSTLGFLPEMLDEDDLRPAAKQFDEAYVGGWSPVPSIAAKEGIQFAADGLTPKAYLYPKDPPNPAIAMCRLRDERVVLFRYGIVSIIQPDNTFATSRLD